MIYRLIQSVEGRVVRSEFTDENVLTGFAARGFKLTDVNVNPRQRAELQGAPRFSGLCGPMWDGDAIRYEDTESNDRLSA